MLVAVEEEAVSKGVAVSVVVVAVEVSVFVSEFDEAGVVPHSPAVETTTPPNSIWTQ